MDRTNCGKATRFNSETGRKAAIQGAEKRKAAKIAKEAALQTISSDIYQQARQIAMLVGTGEVTEGQGIVIEKLLRLALESVPADTIEIHNKLLREEAAKSEGNPSEDATQGDTPEAGPDDSGVYI